MPQRSVKGQGQIKVKRLKNLIRCIIIDYHLKRVTLFYAPYKGTCNFIWSLMPFLTQIAQVIVFHDKSHNILLLEAIN